MVWPLYRIVLVSLCSIAVSMAADPLSALPDQAVTPEQLPPAEREAFLAPFAATISNLAISNPTPPMSFTSGTDRNHLNLHTRHSGFEPMAYRPLMRPIADDPDRVTLSHDHAMQVAEGFYDGARIRVYQAIDGKLVKIRDAVLPEGGHAASGWMPARGSVSCDAQTTEVRIKADERFLVGRDYWFTVVAVDDYGQESVPAPAARVTITEAAGPKTQESKPGGWRRWKQGADGPELPAPATGLAASCTAGVITCTWRPSPSTAIAGYRVKISGYDPSGHRGFAFDLPHRQPRPDRPIQRNDLVFIDHFVTDYRPDQVAPYCIWPNQRIRDPFKMTHIDRQKTGHWWSDGSDYPARWSFVAHPQPIPADFVNHGQTCLRWENLGDDHTGFNVRAHGHPDQSWYPVFEAKEYRVDVWVRGEGTAQLVFLGQHAPHGVELPLDQGAHPLHKEWAIDPIPLPLSDEWRQIRATFTPPRVMDQGVGFLYVSLQGKGVLYMDDLQIYEADHPPGQYHPVTLQKLRESNMRFMRTHELIKTKWGYGSGAITGRPGSNNYSGRVMRQFTFHGLLECMRESGNISPWLQVEMCLNEEEWLGFAEWLCAPYDPDRDTPTQKPWAATRHALGQTRPWIDEFDEFGFEISNETWNKVFAPYDMGWGMTMRDGQSGEELSWGAAYGMLNEYVIGILRSSPYWSDAVEEKMKYFLCGWQASQSYGAEARRYSPSADAITYAAYQHNDWGLGDPKIVNDFKRFYWLQWGQSAVARQAESAAATERQLAAEGLAVESGIYEFGPAYHVMPGDPKEAKEVDAHLARGIVAGVFCLDAVLTRFVRADFTDQAHFTFGHDIGAWGSHSTRAFGAHAYPYWKAFQLYNQIGTGRFLDVSVTSSPTWDFPAYETEDNMHKAKRAALPDAPLISCYASLGDDRLTVFLLSRKIDDFPVLGDDGYTPVRLTLPVQSADSITLYKLTGDPRREERLEELTRLEQETIPSSSFDGTLTVPGQGLPPAAIYAFVLEGIDLHANQRPTALFRTPETVTAGAACTLVSLSHDDGPVTAQWDCGAAGTHTGSPVTVIFPTAGLHAVRLTVTDSHGASQHIERQVAVAVEHEGLRLRPLPQVSWNAAQRLEASSDGPLLTVRSDGDPRSMQPPVFVSAASSSPRLQVAATIDIEAEPGCPKPLGGLVLTTPDKAGLGFGPPILANQQVVALLVDPDGGLWWRVGKQFEPCGSAELPVALSLELLEGAVIASVAGEEVARALAPSPQGFSAGLLAASGQSGQQAPRVTVQASDLRIR